MMDHTDFQQWLTDLRFSRKVCMLIPMEACMGLPVVIRQGEEFLIPFFPVSSTRQTDELLPPFAYLRINYPEANILTYNCLRTLPGWKDMDWNLAAKKQHSTQGASQLAHYYSTICHRPASQENPQKPESLLLESLRALSADEANSPLVAWYQRLMDEAEKYR